MNLTEMRRRGWKEIIIGQADTLRPRDTKLTVPTPGGSKETWGNERQPERREESVRIGRC